MSEPPRLTPVADALEPLLAGSKPLDQARIAIADALGLIAAEPARTSGPVPPLAVALRDGIAVASADIVGATPYAPVILTDMPPAVRSGATLPPATDAVIPAAAAIPAGRLVEIGQAAYPGEQVATAGSDLAGDIQILGRGDLVTPELRLALATAGMTDIAVLRASFAMTPGGDPVVRDWLAARLRALGLTETGEPEAGLIASFGESAGAFANRAPMPVARGLALRPGDNAGTAMASDGRPVILLPERFDGAIAAFYALILPVVARLTARRVNTHTLPLGAKIASTIGCTDVALLHVVDGRYEPLIVGAVTLQALLRADAVALIPPESEGAAAGTPLAAIPIGNPLMPEPSS
ncbi:hypothetical protein [Phreatobacter stygius]|uniref:Molybdopterin molybdenumtransferase n=1 Tax=Phreatobacter stygius TaxID=1940610 RepID=A0A4D7B3M7_9HYPH|nr:hypothetical protein [Phreatobacter stygius]QCI64226.1 hypothetical protein E8M01_08190 [Phreatobacter stygius]